MDISGLDELDVRDIRLTNNENNTDVSLLQFKKNRGSAGQDGDSVGKISFVSYNDAGTPEEITYGNIEMKILDASDTTESGVLTFSNMANGSFVEQVKISNDAGNPTLTVLGGTGSKPALRLQRGEWGTDSYTDWQFRDEGGHLYFSRHSNNTSADNVTFLSGGNVGINNTNPSYKLDVTGDINASGNVSSGGTVLISDDRIKENEQYITDATTTIMRLRPQIYDKKPDLDSVDTTEWHKESGLIAQEVYYDAPELRHLVSAGNNATDIETPINSSDDPSVDPDYSNWGDTPAGLNYIGLISYLIQGFKEQEEAIRDLQRRIDLLENTF